MSDQPPDQGSSISKLFDNQHIWMWVLGGFLLFVIVGTLMALWVKKGRLTRHKAKSAIFNKTSSRT